jgi:hypothetical protein
MAVLETKIYSALSGNATVAAKVGVRIYPLTVPQNSPLPVITYQRVAGNHIHTLTGFAKLENAQINISAWGANYDTVKEIAEDVHVAMDGAAAFNAILKNDMDGYDVDTGLYFVSQEFSCWDQTT